MGCHEKFCYIRTCDVRKYYYGVVIRKLLYTDTDSTRTRHGPDTDKVRARCRVRAKFHYTDPHGHCRRPARTQQSFAVKKVRAGPHGSVSGPCSGIQLVPDNVHGLSGPCRVRVRVRVVEFSSSPTTCALSVSGPVRVGSVSGPCSGIQLILCAISNLDSVSCVLMHETCITPPSFQNKSNHTGWPKKLYIFEHTISLEPFKKK